jgi:hypothetical protein
VHLAGFACDYDRRAGIIAACDPADDINLVLRPPGQVDGAAGKFFGGEGCRAAAARGGGGAAAAQFRPELDWVGRAVIAANQRIRADGITITG